MSAFILLLVQKFIGIFILKILLTWRLPSVKDQSMLFLLGLHLTTFFYFHSKHGKGFMSKIMKSHTRLVLQESFKGYGKGINLLASIYKGLKYDTDVFYFIFVLVVRCSVSSAFKSMYLSTVVKRKPIRFKKTKVNFVFNAIPTIIVYLTIVLIRKTFSYETGKALEDNVTTSFMMFMVISRCVRSLWKVLNMKKKREKKKYKRLKKALKT